MLLLTSERKIEMLSHNVYKKRRKERKTKNTQFYLVNLLVFHCVMNCGYGGWKGRGRYPPQTSVHE